MTRTRGEDLGPMFNWIQNRKFFRWGFLENRWATFHMALGGILATLLLLLPYFQDKHWLAFLWVNILVVILEICEYFKHEGQGRKIEDVYDTVERWFYDTLGDILGADLIAGFIIFQHWWVMSHAG